MDLVVECFKYHYNQWDPDTDMDAGYNFEFLEIQETNTNVYPIHSMKFHYFILRFS